MENQKITASKAKEAVGETIIELTDWIQSVCKDATPEELKVLSEVVAATSELYKAFKL